MKRILKVLTGSFFIIFSLVILVYSEESLEIPKWFLNPPKENNVIYSAGYARMKSPQLAIVAAGDNARAELSRVIQSKITTITKQFLEESKVKDSSGVLEFSEIVSKSVADNTLYFSKIAKQEAFKRNERYIVYVLIRVDLSEMSGAIDGTLNNFASEYTKLNPAKELEELAEEIRGNITKEFKKTAITKKARELKKEIQEIEKKEEAIENPTVTTGRMPDWVKNYPISSEYYIGVGQGSTLENAKDGAINTLVTQIEVNVKAEINNYVREADGVTEEDVSQNIRLRVRENIEDLELIGLWKDIDGEQGYWAYYRLNIAAFKKRELEKMQNAVRNGLDFLKKSDTEAEPSLKFKYAFLGYYLVGKYVTRALKANYNGHEIILVNELARRMQKIMNGFHVVTSTPTIEMDKINSKPVNVKFRVKYGDRPVINFPIRFKNNNGELDISEKTITDSNGEANCILNRAISPKEMQSFLAELDVLAFIKDAVESEEDVAVFFSRIAKLGIPSKEIIVKVNPVVFAFDLNIENDLNFSPKYQKFVKAMSANFKNAFAKKSGAKFTDGYANLKLYMSVDGSINQSSRSGQYYTRIVVTVRIIDTKSNEEIYSKSTPSRGIKGGSVTEEKSVRVACDNYIEGYNDKMIDYILEFLQGQGEDE